MFLLKKRNRSLKTLLSIGGWTYSKNFPKPVSTDWGRHEFAETAVLLIKNLGFDGKLIISGTKWRYLLNLGIDIDWEYPADEEQAQNFVALLQTVRNVSQKFDIITLSWANVRFKLLDAYTTQHQMKKMPLTVASLAGPSNYNKWKFELMILYLDFFNLMAYDYAGSFSTITAHQSNLYCSRLNNSRSTPFSTDAALKDYIKAGVPAHIITLGMPLLWPCLSTDRWHGKTFSWYQRRFISKGNLGL